MSRSVVLSPSPRCASCRLPPRWCVCAGVQTIECPLQVDVLAHRRESWRPSSTGHLINRVISGSRYHLWSAQTPLDPKAVRMAGRELWILHPAGGPVPESTAPEKVHVLLLDGSWREAAAMQREVGGWGRLVGLPMAGESRYWLRAQQDGGRFSTVEALLCLMSFLGLEREEAELRVQFELHVYAGLRSRGNKAAAVEFLRDSPLRAALPELLAQLDVRRPR